MFGLFAGAALSGCDRDMLTLTCNESTLDRTDLGDRLRGTTMKKYAWGATLVAAGLAFQALPASADKLDDVVSRLDKIEKNNARLTNENAALRKQLKQKDEAAIKRAAPAKPGAAPVVATRTPTPPSAVVTPEIDKYGHAYLEHKPGNPLTFYTPGGEITGYGNIDVSVDDTTKALFGNINNNPAFTGGSETFPVGNLDRK